MSRDLSKAIVASPNQASKVFGVGGAHPVHQKSLFVMRFLRRVGDGGEDWKNGMTFMVKSTDRPSVQPNTEELNQYNKKRVIHTGVKYNPVTCTIYDTADGAVQLMWAQYASYYFGDYRQGPSSYSDDIINERMNGNGYGYGIASNPLEPQGINSQFFFDSVEVYQVWGGEYTSYRLQKPKITNYAPDDLSYEDSGPSTVTLTLQYEGIFHENGGTPQLISQNETLVSMFGGDFSGDTFDPAGSATRQTDFTSVSSLSQTNQTTGQLAKLLSNPVAQSNTIPKTTNPTSTGGALSRFGVFDFGDFKTLGNTLPSEISSVAGNHEAAYAVLGEDYKYIPDVGTAINQAAKVTNQSTLDHAKKNNSYLANYVENLTWAYPYSGPDDTVMPVPAPVDAYVTMPEHRRKKGLSLSPVALAALNSRSDGTSQLGQRTNSNYLLGFLNEPVPSRSLTSCIGFVLTDLMINSVIEANAIATGGEIRAFVTISAAIEVNAVSYGGVIDAAIRVISLMDGFFNSNGVDPDSVGLSGDANTGGNDLLLLSGDQNSDGDDTLNYSGDYDGE